MISGLMYCGKCWEKGECTSCSCEENNCKDGGGDGGTQKLNEMEREKNAKK